MELVLFHLCILGLPLLLLTLAFILDLVVEGTERRFCGTQLKRISCGEEINRFSITGWAGRGIDYRFRMSSFHWFLRMLGSLRWWWVGARGLVGWIKCLRSKFLLFVVLEKFVEFVCVMLLFYCL